MLKLAFLAQGTTTLNIEADSVRLAVAQKGRILQWAEKPIEPGLIQEGMVTDPLALGTIIGELITTSNAPRKRIITALTGMRAIPRILSLPRIQATLLDDTVRREARKEMPLALDNLYISWQKIGERGGQVQIYLLGVPRELLDKHMRALQAAGVQPIAMDLKPLALIRAVGKEEAVVADLEEESLTVVLVAESIPVIMRTFPLEREMSLEVKIGRLVEEVTQTVLFYNDSHRGNPLHPATPVYLTGRAVNGSQVSENLRTMMDRPVEIPEPPMQVPPGFPLPSFMVNIGLAMKKV